MHAEQQLIFARYRLDLAREQLWCDSQEIPLPGKAFALLRYLVEHAGQLVSKADLFATLWPGTVVTDGALTFCVGEVRKALGDTPRAPQYIETVPRRGFRFIAKVVSREEEQQRARSRKQGARTSSSSPAPGPQHPIPPLVGRETELAQLHQLLDRSMSGGRQIVFVTGEPGIGKTALIEVFLQNLTSRAQDHEESQKSKVSVSSPAPSPSPLAPVFVGRGQCIEQHGAGEAFLPVLDALGRLARGAGGAQLIALLRTYAPMWLVQLPAFIDEEEGESLQRKVQASSRERMLREMADVLERLAVEQPVILMLEDLHWSDVSTLDLLAFLARRKEAARLLVIGTYRPVEMLNDGHPLQGITQELYAHQLATELPLRVLSEVDIAAYLAQRLNGGARHVPQQNLVWLLHQRTGGNPLFLVSTVEELAAQGFLTQTDHSWALQGEVTDIRIAESIRHLVARQRGRLSAGEQHTLEAASVAGMEFSAAAVAAALTTETLAIEGCCEQLAERQQFLRRVGIEEWPDGTLAARYGFLHALYQQLWHEHVSPTQLQSYHRQIGERKELAYRERTREIAAELAVHFEQGREYGKAVQYLELAARNALRRSAYQEGLSLLNKGLTLLKTLPDTIDHAQQELRLQMLVTTPLIALRGYTAPEVEQACIRAQTLCAHIGESPQLFSVLGGLFSLYFNRGQLQTALQLAQQLLNLAHKMQDQRLLLWAHYTLGIVLEDQGNPVSARIHLEKSYVLYESQQYPPFYGSTQNPGTTGLARLAWVFFSLGYPNQALKKVQKALALARQQAHPFSLAQVLMYAADIHNFRGEQHTAKELEKELFTLSYEHGFSYWSSEGTIRRAWAVARQGQTEEGLAQLQQTAATLQTKGEEIAHPYVLYRLADVYGRSGQREEGLRIVAQGLDIARQQGRVLWEVNFYHQKGNLTLQQKQKTKSNRQKKLSAPNFPSLTSGMQEAEACYLTSIEIARKQQAKSWELQSTISLAHLWQQQGKHHEAHRMLSEVYNWFTEGFETKDLQEAKVLLEALSR